MTLHELTAKVKAIVRASGETGAVCVGADCWSRDYKDRPERVETEYSAYVASAVSWRADANSPEGLLAMVEAEYTEKNSDIELVAEGG